MHFITLLFIWSTGGGPVSPAQVSSRKDLMELFFALLRRAQVQDQSNTAFAGHGIE